jgi:serine/threonine protein kinase
VSRAPEEFGPYLVYERLGQGGMATVHRAEKRGVGIRKPIALKRLLPHVAADPELVKLFVDEARLASRLHHANVAQTYELGKVGEIFFIAMEYASGPTLTQIVRQSQQAAGEIPLTVTVNILSQVCEALDYAHNLCDESGASLRMVHRDVSPANIIVTNTGVVKLIDFGIAKATISSVKTQTGFIKGKFGYIAPEYISGKIDKRADLFAVGVVAHELLSGRRLFEGKDDFETLANIRDLRIAPPSKHNPHVTPDLDDIVMTALARDPDQRWQSAAAMQVALANVAREFGLVVGGPQLAEWIDWAFSQVAGASGPRLPGDEPGPGSSVSIELGVSAIEPLDSTGELRPRSASASESAETVPLDRLDARDLIDTPVVGTPVVAPARASRAQPVAEPIVVPARDVSVMVVAPGEMFAEPAAAPAPQERAETSAIDRRRRLWWGVLVMILLGAGAMAAAYFWPGEL